MSLAMFNAVKANRSLPTTDRLVLYMLADCYNETTGRCDPSIGYLTEVTGLSRRTVQYAIARLVAAGHISRHGRRYLLHLQREARVVAPSGDALEQSTAPAAELTPVNRLRGVQIVHEGVHLVRGRVHLLHEEGASGARKGAPVAPKTEETEKKQKGTGRNSNSQSNSNPTPPLREVFPKKVELELAQSRVQGAAQIPTLEEAQAYAPSAPTPIPEGCVSLWYDKREVVGWTVTRMGLVQPICDWRADLRCFAKTYEQIEQQRRSSASGTASGASPRSGPAPADTEASQPGVVQKPSCPPMPENWEALYEEEMCRPYNFIGDPAKNTGPEARWRDCWAFKRQAARAVLARAAATAALLETIHATTAAALHG